MAAGNVFRRNLDAKIAASDHDRITEPDDVVDVIERGGLLDLCHQLGPIADEPARLDHVPGLLDKRQSDPVDTESQSEGKIGAIFLGQRRKVENRARKVDPLSVRDDSTVDHFRIHKVVANSGCADANPAVIDQEILPRRHGVEDFRMWQWN